MLFDDACAEVCNALSFDGIGIGRKKDGCGNTQRFCGIGDGCTVIAGAGGGDFLNGAAAKIGGKGIECAARLEGVGGEFNFEFEVNWCGAGGKSGARNERCRGQIFGEESLGFPDGGEGGRDGCGHGAVEGYALRVRWITAKLEGEGCTEIWERDGVFETLDMCPGLKPADLKRVVLMC